jgi:putative heme iron utilization protein
MEGEHIMAESTEAPAWTARRLLRAARAGTLASLADGQPFASLVTPALTPDGTALLLLSDLSEHTRHLRAEPRCALMVMGAPDGPNPQTAPRVTVTGLAEQIEDAALKARWLAVHPYAALYADFADFHLWRIVPRAALFVGGFARAARLRRADLVPDPTAVAAIAAAEGAIIAHCNDDHADAMAAIGARAGGEAGPWRMVAADVDGCDLALGERTVRVSWTAPVSGPEEVRRELVRLAREARGAPAAAP